MNFLHGTDSGGQTPDFLWAQPPILHSHFRGLYPRFGDKSTQKPYFTTTSIQLNFERVFNAMSNSKSSSEDSSSDDDRVISKPYTGPRIGPNMEDEASFRLTEEYQKAPLLPPSFQRQRRAGRPPRTSTTTRGNQNTNRRETSKKTRSSSRTRQGGRAVPGAVIANDEGGMSIASSITTSPSNRAGCGQKTNEENQEGIVQAAMSPGTKMDSSVSTTKVENLVDLLAQIQLNADEELNGGNGGDSDAEGEEFELHLQSPDEVTEEGEKDEDKLDAKKAVELEDMAKAFDHKGFVDLTSQGSTDVIGRMAMSADGSGGDTTKVTINDAETEIKHINIYKPPPEWRPKDAEASRGEPPFSEVDNPGNWPEYCFKPKFESRKKASKYTHHCMPTGVRPVPVGVKGERSINGWQFYYNGFKNEEFKYRRGASTSNMFPKEMNGKLDQGVLEALGLTKERMQPDLAPIFFYQLVMPFCDPSKSGIPDDPRMAYYTDVERFTNIGKFDSGKGGTYGHEWKVAKASELVHFDGIMIRDGVLGGSGGAIHQRYLDGACKHDPISECMTFSRLCQLKRVMKMHHPSCPQRGQHGYDPAYKYDLPWRVLTHNTNALTKKADENLMIDEMTWQFCGYGEAGSGVVSRLVNKKVPKGGQTVVLCDVGRIRPRAYIHRHKLNKLPPGYKRQGCGEAQFLMKEALSMVKIPGEENLSTYDKTKKKIFERKPHVTTDNYFMDSIHANWVGENGLAQTSTTARNFLEKEIPRHHLHAEKTNPKDMSAKVARFTKPVVAVKNFVGANGVHYQRTLVSFQSTSSCNLSTVNALNECNLFYEIRERGKGKYKRHWVIEMNDGRRLYLSTYFKIDLIDHLIKNAAIYYRTWKYWHSPKNTATALAVCIAYDMYLECAEGGLNGEWYIPEKM